MTSNLSYAFGGDAVARTPEDLARKRALVDSLLSQEANSPTPKNLGEGLGAIGKALMVRRARNDLSSNLASIQSGQADLSPIIAAALAGQQGQQAQVTPTGGSPSGAVSVGPIDPTTGMAVNPVNTGAPGQISTSPISTAPTSMGPPMPAALGGPQPVIAPPPPPDQNSPIQWGNGNALAPMDGNQGPTSGNGSNWASNSSVAPPMPSPAMPPVQAAALPAAGPPPPASTEQVTDPNPNLNMAPTASGGGGGGSTASVGVGGGGGNTAFNANAAPPAPQAAAPMQPSAATGQLQALITVANDPRFPFASAAKQQMVLGMIQTLQAQNTPMAQLEYQQKLHPDQIPMTPYQKAATEAMGLRTGWVQDPTDPTGQRIIPREGGRYDPNYLATAAGAKDKMNDPQSLQRISDMADAVVKSGVYNPMTMGIFKGPVTAELAKRGFDVNKGVMDNQAEVSNIRAMNSGKMNSMRTALDTADAGINKIEQLNNEWDASGFPALNQVQRLAAESGALGPHAASIVRQLNAEIADVTSNIGQTYMGGNSPTDHGLELAAHNLGVDWGKNTLNDLLGLARFNINARRSNLTQAARGTNGEVLGQQPNNGGTSTAAPAATGAAPAAGKTLTDDELLKKYGGG